MIKRTILQNIRNHLIEPEITVLIGPRQVGKTFLMRLLYQELKKQGEKTVFLNLDIEDDAQFFHSQRDLLSYLHLRVGEGKAYIFIDEIQRKNNVGLFLKGIYDMQIQYKFIVSGSGSLDLKSKIKESMAGRKRLFFIESLSFEEFVQYKTNYIYEHKLTEFFSIEKTQAFGLLEEYLAFGGYPTVVLSTTIVEKKQKMDEVYQSYIEQDISALLGVEKGWAFTNLARIMASQIGCLINVTELSSTIGISNKTIQLYLWYLEQTFILKRVTPFHKNLRSEISKTPIYYFYDTGLRNYLIGLFNIPAIPQIHSGHVFENVVWNMLRHSLQNSAATIHFWRTTNNAEVDFIINTGIKIIPIEVKYKKLQHTQITRSFASFLYQYKPEQAYIIHLGNEMNKNVQTTAVTFLPPYFAGNNIAQKSGVIV